MSLKEKKQREIIEHRRREKTIEERVHWAFGGDERGVRGPQGKWSPEHCGAFPSYAHGRKDRVGQFYLPQTHLKHKLSNVFPSSSQF